MLRHLKNKINISTGMKLLERDIYYLDPDVSKLAYTRDRTVRRRNRPNQKMASKPKPGCRHRSRRSLVGFAAPSSTGLWDSVQTTWYKVEGITRSSFFRLSEEQHKGQTQKETIKEGNFSSFWFMIKWPKKKTNNTGLDVKINVIDLKIWVSAPTIYLWSSHRLVLVSRQ